MRSHSYLEEISAESRLHLLSSFQIQSIEMETEEGNQTLFLLHRLQELKVWQREQELKLLEEKESSQFSEERKDSLSSATETDDYDDDTTIDQDLPYVRETHEDKVILPRRKTFQELLEQELQKEGNNSEGMSPAASTKKPFLKKGFGLQRYTPKKSLSVRKKNNANVIKTEKRSTTLPEIRVDIPSDEPSEVCDSVELSFMEKIKKMQKKEVEELAAFEYLEEAAFDSSFSSNSSAVRRLIKSTNSRCSTTSTPKRKASGSYNQKMTFSTPDIREEDESLFKRGSLDNVNHKGQVPFVYPPIESGIEENNGVVESVNKEECHPSFLDISNSSSKIFSLLHQNSFSVKNINSSPLSKVNLNPAFDRESVELRSFHSKVPELEREIAKYRGENNKLTKMKQNLQIEKRKLAEEMMKFEREKEKDKRKLEEEKRRIKRNEKLLEKAQKELKHTQSGVQAKEVENLQNKIKNIKEDFNKKECKWNSTIKKLQDKIKSLEKENQHLHEENHKLKLRRVSSKVFGEQMQKSNETSPQLSQKISPKPEIIETKYSQEAEILSNGKESDTSEVLPFTYSSVDSLESSITLVENSTTVTQISEDATLTDVKHNVSKGTTEKTYSDGTTEITYANGNRKEVKGNIVKVLYYNGDIKITDENAKITKYYYSQTKTWHLTLPDKEIFKFENGQKEIRHRDGTVDVTFSDGSVKNILPDGSETITFPDRTRISVKTNGDKVILFPNGQVETHTPKFKKREYLDGTFKLLYNDGRSETRYTNGRIRIKDQNGSLIYDSADNNDD